MNVGKSVYSFEFDDYHATNNKVGEEVADQCSIIIDGDRVLLLNVKTKLSQFNTHRVLVHLLQESAAERVRYPIRRPDDRLGQRIDFNFIKSFIRVHLCSSVANQLLNSPAFSRGSHWPQPRSPTHL